MSENLTQSKPLLCSFVVQQPVFGFDYTCVKVEKKVRILSQNTLINCTGTFVIVTEKNRTRIQATKVFLFMMYLNRPFGNFSRNEK